MAREKIPEHTERAATFCRNAKPEEKQYELHDSKIPGLQLRVNPSGKKSWALRYSVGTGVNLVKNRLPLGHFPEVTVTEARKEAQQAKSDIARGSDPVGERKAEAERKIEQEKAKEREEASRVTFAQFFETWMLSGGPQDRVDGGAEVRRSFEADALPLLGKKDIREITGPDVLKVTTAIKARAIPGARSTLKRTANKVFADIRQMLRYAALLHLIPADPTAAIPKSAVGGTQKPRQRVLDFFEINKLNKMLAASSLNRSAQLAYLIMLSTLCRVGEFTLGEWRHVNFDSREWKIPDDNTKNGMPHKIFLSDYAISLFEELRTISGHTKWLMPNRMENGHLDLKALTKHARDRQRPEGHEPTQGRTIETRSLASGDEPWTPHDLRRTGSTMMQELDFIPEISDRCLNHVEEEQLRSTYLVFKYEQQMREAWYLLGDALETVTGSRADAFLKAYTDNKSKHPRDQLRVRTLVEQYANKSDERSQPA